MIRRFSRKAQQSGLLGVARRKQFFDKPLSKKVLRMAAIRKRHRRELKIRKAYIGR